MMKSMPVWRMAVSQVSPSIPTQADAAQYSSLEEPEGLDGVGTVKVPVTVFHCRASINLWALFDRWKRTYGLTTWRAGDDGTRPVLTVLDVCLIGDRG